MELKRLAKALGERWTLVVGLCVLGVVAALVLGSFANRNQAELYEATAAIRFNPNEGETIADLADDIAAAQDLALIAAADLIEADPNLLIVQDLANSRLLFIAEGSSSEEAETKARTLRQSYLNVDPLVGGLAIDQRLEDIQERAGEVQAEIDSLQPAEEPVQEVDPDVAAERALLEAQIGAVTQRLVDLAVLEGSADAETRQAILVERANQEAKLAELREALSEIPVNETRELTVEEQLRLASLQAQLEALIADYQRLSLRQEGVTDEGLEQVSILDLTPEPLPTVVTASIGLLGGMLIAVLALVFINRTRRPVWLPEDIRVQVLGSVPPRRINLDTSENWYETADPGPRKEAIQALRAAVEAQLASTGATIAVTGLGAAPDGVQALSADLAGSMASAGKSVLLIDANFAGRSPLGLYRSGGPAVSEVLAMSPLAPEFKAQVMHTVESAQMVAPGLAVIPSGPPPASPADALAGRQFRNLIAEGQETYDVVLVVVDEIDTPAAQVAMQRLGHGLLLLTPGTTTRPEVDQVLRDAERLRISLLGAVFIEKQSRILASVATSENDEASPRHQDVTGVEERHSPISRLHNYPIPDERRSSAVQRSSLADLATNIGVASTNGGATSELGASLLVALGDADTARAASSVREYLIAQTEDMVLARHGHGGLTQELIGAMSDYGFLSLRPLKGLSTVSEWLKHEIANETGASSAEELIRSMERALGRGEERSIDQWLAEEFFRRHLERTRGEPEVCHVTSPEQTIGVLVPIRRLSVERLNLILAEVAARDIDHSERLRSAAVTRGDLEDASRHEAHIHDVRAFEKAVTSLTESHYRGDKAGPKKAHWRFDWSKGTRHNLAPLQYAGLLPFEVLTAEEMSEFSVSA